MSAHELCPACKPSGACWFEKQAESTAGGVPPLEAQTPIAPGEKITMEAFDAHQTIFILRTEAREMCCPKINSVNPVYPGIENL